MNKYQCQVEVEANSQEEAELKAKSIYNLIHGLEQIAQQEDKTVLHQTHLELLPKLKEFKKHNLPMIQGITQIGEIFISGVMEDLKYWMALSQINIKTTNK